MATKLTLIEDRLASAALDAEFWSLIAKLKALLATVDEHYSVEIMDKAYDLELRAMQTPIATLAAFEEKARLVMAVARPDVGADLSFTINPKNGAFDPDNLLVLLVHDVRRIARAS